MTNENPTFDLDKTQEFHPAKLKHKLEVQIEQAGASLESMVAEISGGIVLDNLKFYGMDLTLVGTDENGVRFSIPFDEFESVKLRPK